MEFLIFVSFSKFGQEIFFYTKMLIVETLFRTLKSGSFSIENTHMERLKIVFIDDNRFCMVFKTGNYIYLKI